jgi:hypothetical protein
MAIWARNYRAVIGESFPVPLLDVFLLGSSGRVQISALVDSGAFRSVFPLTAAEDAGIDLSKAFRQKVRYGVSGSDGWVVPVRLELGEDGPKIDASALFVERLEFPYALLGRIGFFDRFNEVAFIHKSGRNPRFELRY